MAHAVTCDEGGFCDEAKRSCEIDYNSPNSSRVLFTHTSILSGFACALAGMYETENEMRVEECDVVGILAAAHCLGFAALERV